MQSGLSDSLGSSFGPLASYALAAVVVLVLILVVLFVAKRMLGNGSVGLSARKGPRLAVLDVAAVDQRRKLVLVRRDEVEHLILVGGQNDLLVEGGILRVPASLRQPQVERPGTGRDESEVVASGFPSLDHPPLISPKPRQPPLRQGVAPRSPSPLRRPVPRAEPQFSPNAAVAAPMIGNPAVEDGGRPDAPAVAASTMEPSVVRGHEVLPVEPARGRAPEFEPAVPEPDTAPVSLEPAIMKDETTFPSPPETRPAPPADGPNRGADVTPHEAPVASDRRASEPEEPDVRIPQFLRRTDAPTRLEPSPFDPVRPPLSAPSPAPIGLNSASADEAEDERRVEPRLDVAPTVRSEPVIPLGIAPAVEPFDPPVAAPSMPVPPVEAPHSAGVGADDTPLPVQSPNAPQVRAQGPAMETAADGERRPLSVRSFATTIQSRRQNFEPMRAGVGEDPAPAARLSPPPPPPSLRSEPMPLPSSTEKPASPTEDESNLDDVLTRELDSGFGSLDWPGEQNRPAQKAQAEPLPPPPPSPAPVEPPVKPNRPLTLEEEMERLLGDFDFSQNRR